MNTMFIAFSSRLIRDAIKLLLRNAGFSVTGEAEDLKSALKLLDAQPRTRVDTIIMDAEFCNGSPGAVATLRNVLGDVRIIVLTYESDIDRIHGGEIMTADGILTFSLTAESVIDSIRLIQVGERVVPQELINSLLAREAEELSQSAQTELLARPEAREQAPSPREAEILRYLVRGASNKTIARELGITESTVKVHLKSLLRKLRVGNRTQAAIWALNNGSASKTSPPSLEFTSRSPAK
jgi:two-component system nitrate/nitrite response regulator NarL